MAKFSRSDIRQFFRDTISEMYDYGDDPRTMIDPETGEEINIDIMRVPKEDRAPFPDDYSDEPDPRTIRRRTRAWRRAYKPEPLSVNVPSEEDFETQLRQRRKSQRLSRQKLRDMIDEAIRLGYHDAEGDERSEFYDEADFMDPDDPTMVIPPAGDREYAYLDPSMKYSVDDSTDVMDSDDLDLYGDLGGMEREMMGQGRYPAHHHDDDYSDLGDMDMLGDDLDAYNPDEDLVMERKKIRQIISKHLKRRR